MDDAHAQTSCEWLQQRRRELSAVHHLFDAGQEEPNEVELTVLHCAAEAKISKRQWEVMRGKLGIEKIEDFVELYPAAYERCKFKPLLNQRIQKFQSAVLMKFRKSPGKVLEEKDVTASASGDPVPKTCPSVPASPLQNPLSQGRKERDEDESLENVVLRLLEGNEEGLTLNHLHSQLRQMNHPGCPSKNHCSKKNGDLRSF